MLIKKPNFWDEDRLSFFSAILIPLTIVLKIAVFFKQKLTREIKYNLPVICVGNIYIGGTGKTPLCIEITKILKEIGKNPVIIKKFYKEHEDEHLLTKHKIREMIVEKTRKKALVKAIENNYDLAVLDDGLQDASFYKDLKISCFTNTQWLGNNMTLPSGPLRETLSAVKKHHIAVINCQTDKNRKNIKEELLKINNNIDVYFSRYEVDKKNIDKFKNKKFLAFAGIGNPENFFNLLSSLSFLIEKKNTLSRSL